MCTVIYNIKRGGGSNIKKKKMARQNLMQGPLWIVRWASKSYRNQNDSRVSAFCQLTVQRLMMCLLCQQILVITVCVCVSAIGNSQANCDPLGTTRKVSLYSNTLFEVNIVVMEKTVIQMPCGANTKKIRRSFGIQIQTLNELVWPEYRKQNHGIIRSPEGVFAWYLRI